MIERLLSRLFGKRYRTGWPRGVQPMSPWLQHVRDDHPELWEQVRHLPPSEGMRRLREAGVI